MKLPTHESTTAQLGVAYPFAASAPLPVSRVLGLSIGLEQASFDVVAGS
ncbi:MAG: hypothetical protein ABR972_13990 [Acidimicrobiales bacterium]